MEPKVVRLSWNTMTIGVYRCNYPYNCWRVKFWLAYPQPARNPFCCLGPCLSWVLHGLHGVTNANSFHCGLVPLWPANPSIDSPQRNTLLKYQMLARRIESSPICSVQPFLRKTAKRQSKPATLWYLSSGFLRICVSGWICRSRPLDVHQNRYGRSWYWMAAKLCFSVLSGTLVVVDWFDGPSASQVVSLILLTWLGWDVTARGNLPCFISDVCWDHKLSRFLYGPRWVHISLQNIPHCARH